MFSNKLVHIFLSLRIKNFSTGNVQFGFVSISITFHCKQFLEEKSECYKYNRKDCNLIVMLFVLHVLYSFLFFYWSETWIVRVCIFAMPSFKFGWCIFFVCLIHHNSFSAFDRNFMPFCVVVHFFSFQINLIRLNSMYMQKSSRSYLILGCSHCTRLVFSMRRTERGSDRTKIYIMIHSDWIIAHRHSWSHHIASIHMKSK